MKALSPEDAASALAAAHEVMTPEEIKKHSLYLVARVAAQKHLIEETLALCQVVNTMRLSEAEVLRNLSAIIISMQNLNATHRKAQSRKVLAASAQIASDYMSKTFTDVSATLEDVMKLRNENSEEGFPAPSFVAERKKHDGH